MFTKFLETVKFQAGLGLIKMRQAQLPPPPNKKRRSSISCCRLARVSLRRPRCSIMKLRLTVLFSLLMTLFQIRLMATTSHLLQKKLLNATVGSPLPLLPVRVPRPAERRSPLSRPRGAAVLIRTMRHVCASSFRFRGRVLMVSPPLRRTSSLLLFITFR